MVRADDRAAYPVVDDIPVLLGPELLAATASTFDLHADRYAEAYSEQDFYDAEADAKSAAIGDASSLTGSTSESIRHLGLLHRAPAPEVARFPHPPLLWLQARMDVCAEWDCYEWLGAIGGRDVAQFGGSGVTALMFLIAGARAALLLTPVLGEARLARRLAHAIGAQGRLRCVIGIAEEVPLADGSFDAVFSAGSVHHMTTALALPEIARVLRPGGRFAAMEPWRAPLYALGTGVLGKRERSVFCRPLTPARTRPMFDTFPTARVIHHGTLTRYPMLAIEKLGLRFPLRAARLIGQIDDRVCGVVPGLRRFGSSVALLAEKR